MKYFSKNVLATLSFTWLFLLSVSAGDFPIGSIEWYRNGPDKDWSPEEHEMYFQFIENSLSKQAEDDPQLLRRQKAIMNGNKITTEIWNYGSISSPGNRITDIVWEELGYGYEFGPFICAEVPVVGDSLNRHPDAFQLFDDDSNAVLDEFGNEVWKARVISDGLISSGGETAPDGSEFWGWAPLAYDDTGLIPYADPLTDRLPTSNDIDRDNDGKPDSWPAGWYNDNLQDYVWPGALRQGSTNSDLETLFIVDDRSNVEFTYYPFIDDSSRRGLGIEIESRYYQWANPLAEDIIFLIYKVTNKSDKDLNDVTFGMWGDPHIGGPNNYGDDLAFFDNELNMVYAWDENGKSDISGKVPGYFGYKFLESPGNPLDGIDNDGDGMIDESWYNNIDDDGDWNPEFDDLGVDGLPDTGDEGEGDELPTAGDPFDPRKPGEPNYEFTDLDESDMIGLTSFAAPSFGGNNRISNDDFIIQSYMTPGHFDTTNAAEAGDNVFLYGSGKFTLPAGESRRFSIALLVGEDFDDLTLNATTADQIYEGNYQFAQPPPKPTLSVVPGDAKVSLYWDTAAENAFDPISRTNDFEGYVIYRSTDPSFFDQQTITDVNGSRFLFEPLTTVNGDDAKFDLDNGISGISVPYFNRGVGYYMGDDTGIRHSYTDSNNVINGQTYYYALVSYDHGDPTVNLAPSECSKNILLDPETNELFLDINTVQTIPRAPASGYVAGYVPEMTSFVHDQGSATGSLQITVMNPELMDDNNLFEITFDSTSLAYSVEDKDSIIFGLSLTDDYWFQMPYQSVNIDGFTLQNSNGDVFLDSVDYLLRADRGQLRRISDGNIDSGENLTAIFTYFPIFGSEYLDNEDGNAVFDGMKLFVQDNELTLDPNLTGWFSSTTSNLNGLVNPFNSDPMNKWPANYEIRWSSSLVDTSDFFKVETPFEIFDVTPNQVPEKIRFEVIETGGDNLIWEPGDLVVIYKDNGTGFNLGWQIDFQAPSGEEAILPSDGDIYSVYTKRPFTGEDVYTFVSKASYIDEEAVTQSLENISVVPNPYVAFSIFEPFNNQEALERDNRRIYFDHLPANCTINIYTIAGEHVQTLEHNKPFDDGQEFWNLTTKDNFPIAYGIYIYHVDAGELGQHIGRFAVIK